MTDRELMQQALEALEHVIYWDNEKPEWEYAHAAIAALRERLAQPEQKPVAWAIIGDGEWGEYTYGMHFENSAAPNHKYWEVRGYELQPLYTSPQPAQQPEQEPVAWADECRIELVTAIHTISSDYENALGVLRDDPEARRKAEGDIAHARKIAAKWNWNGTAPQAQQPLTDEQIDGLWDDAPTIPQKVKRREISRRVEAAHGIKEQP